MSEMPFTAMAQLAQFALDQLHIHAASEPCCSHCCSACAALITLFESGQLDELVATEGPGSAWWDAENGRVDQAWLARHIEPQHYKESDGRMVSCRERS